MHQLEDIEVSAMRVQQTTLSTAVVKTDELNRDNTGQNLPYLLTTTPGLQVTSDDGLGVGYTYFRVRGTDHTRINMTVNEVPLNDQESQTVFWVNMTDMSSSISQVDVQRGVGTSTSGSAFGASLNMQTNMLDSVSRLTLAFNGGMYNTFREMVNAHASISNRWMMNARFTKVNSDGFLYRTNSDLYSYYGDIGWYGKKTQVILRAFGGAETTGMSWEGTRPSIIPTKRITTPSSTDNCPSTTVSPSAGASRPRSTTPTVAGITSSIRRRNTVIGGCPIAVRVMVCTKNTSTTTSRAS